MIYSPYVNTLIQPIGEENPAGRELSIEDDDFYWVDSEIRRAESPLQAQSGDWTSIVGRCEELLEKKSKDLRLATYLCRGRFQLWEYHGLSEGLELCLALFQEEKLKASLKITEQSLENLKSEGVLDDVLEKLQSLKNQEFIGEKDFLVKLEETIGAEQTVRFKSSILKHALKETFYPRDPQQRRSLLLALSTAIARFVERRSDEESDATEKELDEGGIKELLAKKEMVDQCVKFLSALNSIAEKQWGEPLLAALASAIGEIQMKVDRNAAPFLEMEEEKEEGTSVVVETEPEDKKEDEKDTEMERDRTLSKRDIVVDGNYLPPIEAANREFEGGNWIVALQLVGEAYENAWHPREKWILKFHLLQLCIQAGRLLLAETLLKKLKAEIEPHKAWEPILYADLLVVEFGLQPRLKDDTTYKQDKPLSENLYAALCESSPLKAIDFDAARYQEK